MRKKGNAQKMRIICMIFVVVVMLKPHVETYTISNSNGLFRAVDFFFLYIRSLTLAC